MVKLDIPEANNDPAELGAYSTREGMQRWIGELPLANVDLCVDELLQKLDSINRTAMEPLRRFQLMQITQPVVENLIDTLRDRYGRALQPLAPRYFDAFRHSVQLSTIIAVGFKRVLHDLIADPRARAKAERMELASVYMAMHHCSLILLEAYIVYAPEPQHVWSEISALYRYAESRAVLDVPIMYPDTSNEPRTISLTYRRAVLLALANPYHLMQQEALTVFKLLHKLAGACTLTRAHETLIGCFYIDLKADSGPKFAAKSQAIHPIEARGVDLPPLLAVLKKRIHALSSKSDDERIRKMPRLVRRIQRDMLRRLASSWGRTTDRQHERFAKLGGIMAAASLSAAHHHCGQAKPFAPEMDEIRIHTGYSPRGSVRLSLVPLDFAPWQSEDAAQRLNTGVHTPRTSRFGDERAIDIWEKIYAHDTGMNFVREDKDDTEFAPTAWELRNESKQGLNLYCEASAGMPLRVGEIIIYRPATDDGSAQSWNIGAIRWLRVTDNHAIQMGIQRLSQGASAVATRAVRGIGAGGEYFRSLIVPAVALDDPSATLIVPAAIYDVDTILALNFGDSITYVRLAKIAHATKSYTQFHFKTVAQPESEARAIDTMRKLL